MRHNQLVRDNIPDIIREKGGTPVTHVATSEEYGAMLDEKLLEECTEFFESRNPEELADILEVVRALATLQNLTAGELERIRQKKADDRGGFEKHIILEEA